MDDGGINFALYLDAEAMERLLLYGQVHVDQIGLNYWLYSTFLIKATRS